MRHLQADFDLKLLVLEEAETDSRAPLQERLLLCTPRLLDKRGSIDKWAAIMLRVAQVNSPDRPYRCFPSRQDHDRHPTRFSASRLDLLTGKRPRDQEEVDEASGHNRARSPPSTHVIGGKHVRDRLSRQGRSGARNDQRRAAKNVGRRVYNLSKTPKKKKK